MRRRPEAAGVADPGAARLGRQPVLDGTRGAAWLVVFVAHADLVRQAAIGQVAMFVFFALSGFLITSMVVEEQRATGRVSLRNFFARRALRLLPALALFLVAWLVVALVAGGEPWMTTVPGSSTGGTLPVAVALQGFGAAAGYLTNWSEIAGWFSGYVPLGHLWSLAVEEQFYVVWAPLLVVLLARGRRIAAGVALALCALSLLDVTVLHPATSITLRVDMGTDTRAAAFLAGALAALAFNRRWAAFGWLRSGSGRPAVGAALAAMTWSAWVFDHPTTRTTFALAWVGASLSAAVLVVALVRTGQSARRGPLSHPVLVYLGSRSYALYLWHYVWLTWFHSLGLAGVAAALVASLVCAELSWRLVEQRALALKHRFTSPVPDPPRTATVPATGPSRPAALGMPLAGRPG